MAAPGKNSLTRGKKQAGDEAAHAGRLDEALALFGAVCRKDPADAEAWVKRAMVEKRLGQVAQAEASARRAVALAPGIGFTHHALAVALHTQGRFDEAIVAYRQAIKRLPGFADAHHLLGCALRSTGDLEGAAASQQHALALQPDYAEASSELGTIRLVQCEFEAGLPLLQKAAAMQPANIETQCNLAQALRALDRMPEAIEVCRRALRWVPDSAAALASLASLLERSSRLDEARDCLARAQSQHHPALMLVAARLAFRDKRHEEAVRGLQALLATPDLAPDLAIEAELLLGQAHDQLDQPEAAFRATSRGKLRRQQALSGAPNSDPRRYLDEVASLHGLCDEALAQCEPLALDDGQPADPVFVVGFPRSGTTLLEQMLDAHPRLAAMEERPAVRELLRAFWAEGASARPAALTPGRARELRAVYWAEALRHVSPAAGQRLVDKLPLNIVAVPLLWRLFPRARFVLALRHPCDVVLSCFMQDFAVNAAMANFNSLDASARLYHQVMSGWLDVSRKLPVPVHVIRYEDLIADVPGELQRLMGFLDLPWDEALLGHAAHALQRKAINTPSYQQVVQPIYRSAHGRWRRYQAQFTEVLPLLQPCIEAFGYTEAPG